MDGNSKENKTISVNADSTKTISFDWIATAGIHIVAIRADPDDSVQELNESNNQASKDIEVISPTFKVLVVATYYQDESLEDIQKHESKLNESLENTKGYYLKESFDRDHIWFSDPVYLQMPHTSGYYYDWPISASDKSYTPHPKYAWDVQDTLREMGYDQEEYDAILTCQTDINSHSYEGGFRAVVYRFPAIQKDDKPIIAVDIKDSYGIFAHELGHALYGFDDFYSEKLLILERNRGEVEYWGLMGRGGRLASKAPIISFNKVRAGWLEYDPISGESIATQGWVTFTLYPYEDMDYGNSIIKIAGLEDPGIDYSYDFILELRKKHLEEYTPGGVPPFPTYWIEEPGVLIYQDHHGLLGSYLETIPAISLPPNPTNLHYLQTISDFIPSYKHPVTGLEFGYLGDSNPSPEVFEPPVKIKVGFDVSTYSDMKGIILNNLDIYSLKNLSLAPLVDITYPDIDLHAYTSDGRHIGMNHSSGVYENEILGAIASGDMITEEWVFVPSNLDVRFVVDSHDVQKYLEEINSSETLITNYTIQMMEYGENPSVEVIDGNVIITGRMIYDPIQKTIEPDERETFIPVHINVTKKFKPQRVWLTEKGRVVPGVNFPSVHLENTRNASIESVVVRDEIPGRWYVPEIGDKSKSFDVEWLEDSLRGIGYDGEIDMHRFKKDQKPPVFVFLVNEKRQCKHGEHFQVHCNNWMWLRPEYYNVTLSDQNLTVNIPSLMESNVGRYLEGNESIVISYMMMAQGDDEFEEGNLTTETFVRAMSPSGMYNEKIYSTNLTVVRWGGEE